MTTILADARLGLMVADSSISDDDRVWLGRKVWRIRGALVGIAGVDDERQKFLGWYRAGMKGKPQIGMGSALILSDEGLFYIDANYPNLQKHEHGREAIGTGAKAAMCAYEAMRWSDPRRAVRIVCRHDSGSRAPVRVYKLKAQS